MLDFNKFQVSYDDVQAKPYLKSVVETVVLYKRVLEELAKPTSDLDNSKKKYDDMVSTKLWYEDMPIMKVVDEMIGANAMMIKLLLDQNDVLRKGFSELYEYLENVQEKQASVVEEEGSLVEPEQKPKTRLVPSFPPEMLGVNRQ